MLRAFSCFKVDGDLAKASNHQVVEEVLLQVEVNGRRIHSTTLSPAMFEEYVMGYLFSEGILNGPDQVESLVIEGDEARVTLEDADHLVVQIPGEQRIGPIPTGQVDLPKIASDLRVGLEDIRSAVEAISSSKIHRATGGVHSAGLFSLEGPVIIVEDLGRHNALDKVLGYGLKEKVAFSQTFLASTSRISYTMVLKIARAGIPLVASRGASTSLALTTAKRSGLAVVGFVRGSKMNVYTCPWRVVGLKEEVMV